jgi:hypothetical protein
VQPNDTFIRWRGCASDFEPRFHLFQEATASFKVLLSLFVLDVSCHTIGFSLLCGKTEAN